MMSMSSRVLPITRRGQFFKDDFFRDFQNDYSSAVTDVLDRWGGRALLADQFALNRNARLEDPQTEDSGPAASISETPESYVIVLDMTEYVSGEITVRTKGLHALVDASAGSKNFHRTYPLPRDANTDALSAAMSDEGILTVTAKRQGSAARLVESVDEASALPDNLSKLKIDAGVSSDRTDSGTPCDEMYKILPISRRGQFFKDQFFEGVWKDFDTAMEDMVTRQKQRKEKQLQRDQARKESIQKMLSEVEKDRRHQRTEMRRKASEVMRQHLADATPVVDRVCSYRTLRSWAGEEDNQASTITADDKAYKVVLDVKDFADGELDLKSDGEKLTVLGGKKGIKFQREFSLPGMASPDQVTASLSEDGVLTITADKK